MATRISKRQYHHFVLPHKHKDKHRKAHLLSYQALLGYIVFFVVMQFCFTTLRTVQPGVLGTTSQITREEVITLTNQEREKNGLPPLKENALLDKAAEDKAKNMFSENYWAHNSPSGKNPWVWFKQEGYEYLYAGENLARGYSTSTDTVKAWMDSKMGHRENLLGENYQEIGIAVEDGILNGEKTTLVVQHFGTPMNAEVIPDIADAGAKTVAENNLATAIPSNETEPITQEVNSVTSHSAPPPSYLSKFVSLNPYRINHIVAGGVIAFLVTLSLIDIYFMRQKKAYISVHARHWPHAGIIMAAGIILFILQAGAII